MAPTDPPRPPAPTEDPTTVAEEWLTAIKALASSGDYLLSKLIRDQLSIVSASLEPVPKVTCRLTVTTGMCNGMGNLHGGAAATICDECTAAPFALISKKGFWQYGGVSRTINMVYMHAIPDGEQVDIQGKIVSIGKRLGGFTR